MKMTKFRELNVGDTFDFISPDRMLNSYFRRCVKTGTRTYTPVEGEDAPAPIRVGSINANVYHVNED
jgi:hypothetical protein